MANMGGSPWQRGEAVMRDAEEKERRGNKKAALEAYMTGLSLMVQALRNMPLSQLKQRRQQIVNVYMTHSESLKQDLAASGAIRGPKKPIKVHGKLPHYMQQHQRKQPAPSSGGKGRRNSSNNLRARVESEIIAQDLKVTFDDVVGLADVKQALLEAVILPAQRPDIFTGPRAPPKGLLMFGPPGNGKTFIAKALAAECQATFFCVSASSLTSRYVGEGEKMVRALFELARDRAPSIIFVDEIDSLLTARGGDGEQESSRRMKTEFMVQMDGVQSGADGEAVLLVGATNLPWELDDAILRRFNKKIMVPLPDAEQRQFIITKVLGKDVKHRISKGEMRELSRLTDGYSASDLTNLVGDAAMGPVRDMGMDVLNTREIPPVTFAHFRASLDAVKPSYAAKNMDRMLRWDRDFGTKLNVSQKPRRNSGKQQQQEKPQQKAKNGERKGMFAKVFG